MSSTPPIHDKSRFMMVAIFFPIADPSMTASMVETIDRMRISITLMSTSPAPKPTPSPSRDNAIASEVASLGESLRDWSLSATLLSM